MSCSKSELLRLNRDTFKSDKTSINARFDYPANSAACPKLSLPYVLNSLYYHNLDGRSDRG